MDGKNLNIIYRNQKFYQLAVGSIRLDLYDSHVSQCGCTGVGGSYTSKMFPLFSVSVFCFELFSRRASDIELIIYDVR